MLSDNALVVVCKTADETEAAVAALSRRGIEPSSISVVMADEPGGLGMAAYYFEDGSLRCTAASESCQRLWQALPGCAVVVSRSEQTAVLAGPLAKCVVRALENAGLLGDLGPIAGGLYNLGVPRDAARYYELAALQGHPLVIVHGRAKDVDRARLTLVPWL